MSTNTNPNPKYDSKTAKHLPRIDGLDKSGRVDDATAGAVDHPDTLLAFFQVSLADEPLSLRG